MKGTNMNAREICKARRVLAVTLCLLILFSGARAITEQSANKIVEKYVKAKGGENRSGA